MAMNRIIARSLLPHQDWSKSYEFMLAKKSTIAKLGTRTLLITVGLKERTPPTSATLATNVLNDGLFWEFTNVFTNSRGKTYKCKTFNCFVLSRREVWSDTGAAALVKKNLEMRNLPTVRCTGATVNFNCMAWWSTVFLQGMCLKTIGCLVSDMAALFPAINQFGESLCEDFHQQIITTKSLILLFSFVCCLLLQRCL